MKQPQTDFISVGCRHTVELRSNGIVTAVGDNKSGQCNAMGVELNCSTTNEKVTTLFLNKQI